jgi:hypothetical protein
MTCASVFGIHINLFEIRESAYRASMCQEPPRKTRQPPTGGQREKSSFHVRITDFLGFHFNLLVYKPLGQQHLYTNFKKTSKFMEEDSHTVTANIRVFSKVMTGSGC